MSAMQLLLLSNLHHITTHVVGFQTIPTPTGNNCLDAADSTVATGQTGGFSLGSLAEGIANFFTGGLAGVVQNAIALAYRIMRWLWELVDNRPAFFKSMAQWGLETFFPTSLQTWFGGTISGSATLTGCGASYTPTFNIYGDLYDNMTGAAAIIAAAAAACWSRR